MTEREENLFEALEKIRKTVRRERTPLQSPSVLEMIDRIERIIFHTRKDNTYPPFTKTKDK